MGTLLSQQKPEHQAAWNHREARFYRATGYLAPWKSIPIDMPPDVRARQHLYELRQKAWDTWKAANEARKWYDKPLSSFKTRSEVLAENEPVPVKRVMGEI